MGVGLNFLAGGGLVVVIVDGVGNGVGGVDSGVGGAVGVSMRFGIDLDGVGLFGRSSVDLAGLSELVTKLLFNQSLTNPPLPPRPPRPPRPPLPPLYWKPPRWSFPRTDWLLN